MDLAIDGSISKTFPKYDLYPFLPSYQKQPIFSSVLVTCVAEYVGPGPGPGTAPEGAVSRSRCSWANCAVGPWANHRDCESQRTMQHSTIRQFLSTKHNCDNAAITRPDVMTKQYLSQPKMALTRPKLSAFAYFQSTFIIPYKNDWLLTPRLPTIKWAGI